MTALGIVVTVVFICEVVMWFVIRRDLEWLRAMLADVENAALRNRLLQSERDGRPAPPNPGFTRH